MWQELATKLREKWFGEDYDQMWRHFLIKHLARLGEAKPLFGIVDELMPRNELLLVMLPGEWDLMFCGLC